MTYLESKYPRVVKVEDTLDGQVLVDLSNRPVAVSPFLVPKIYRRVESDELLTRIMRGINTVSLSEYVDILRLSKQPTKVSAFVGLFWAVALYCFATRRNLAAAQRRLFRAVFALSIVWGLSPNKLLSEDLRELYDNTSFDESDQQRS
jgi:hypothetical protein